MVWDLYVKWKLYKMIDVYLTKKDKRGQIIDVYLTKKDK